MTSERRQKVEEIFEKAAQIISTDERSRFLTEACAGDDKLKTEIEKRLAQLPDAPPDPLIGKVIGAFRLKSKIGRGGMGAVYLAERSDGSFRQKVAIKLVKRGMDTDFILRRFRQERQIAAALSHPYIARLLGGGTTDDHLPYFVMEFVEGEPIYKYADEKNLSINERLKLFRKVCQAVDYAHQNQIIHRDIKPPNILVTASGTPKLLDFGIAKVLNPELSLDTIDPTATAMRLMTPEYASPEQVCGSPVTPASDIYSLGVLLYELLTGHRPYQFESRAPHEIARVICDQEPLRPSFLVIRHSPENEQAATSTGERKTDGRPVKGEERISSDLEKIILKSLRKDATERYQTAADFADDIKRYLDGKTIAAESFLPLPAAVLKNSSPDRKTVKSLAVLPLRILNLSAKNDTDESFLSVGLADAIITRLSGIKSLAVRPTSAVLRYIGENIDPITAGGELAVRFILDGRIKVLGSRIRVSLQLLDVKTATSVWANKFDEDFTDALDLEDSISRRVADAILPQLTETERQKIRKRGTDNPQAFEAYLRGRYYWNQFTAESLPKALVSFQKAVELDMDYALAYVGLADFYTWAGIYGIIPETAALPSAEQAARRAIKLDDSLGEAYAALGLVNSNLRNWNECERLYKKALELNPNYPQTHEWNAALLVGTGRFEEGIREIHRAGELDPLSLRTMTLVAWTNYQARRFDSAIEKARQIIDLDKNYPQGYLQLGNALMELGRFDEAVDAIKKCVSMMPDSTLPHYVLCFALARANRTDEARAVLLGIKQAAETGYVKPYFLGMSHAAVDECDTAFKYFEQAVEENDGWILWFGTEAKLDFLRGDARFIKLFERTNNPLARKRKTGDREEPAVSGEKSIAVLPLKLLGVASGEDTGDDYLCTGLADALITRLSNVRRFLVRPTSCVLPYGRNPVDAFTAGGELGVDFIVSGTIRRAGERLRISAQLLSVKDNSIRWAQSFDEKFEDVLALEDTVSEQVSRAILPHLTGEEKQRLKKRGTDNPQAFEAYLRGRFYWNTFTEEGFAKSLVCYNRAIAIAPDYALAYAGIADYYNLLGVYSIMPFAETSAAAKEAALQAIAADDQLAEGYAALGFAVLMHDFDWMEAEKHLRRAVELNPNYVTGLIWHSSFLCLQGRWDEAIKQLRRALELDPHTPVVSHSLNLTLY